MTAPARRLPVASQKPLTSANDYGPNVAQFPARQSSEFGFGQKSLAARRMRDPLVAYASFADRWRDFLRAHFKDVGEVDAFFRVSTKAAEKWWNGIGGANGAKLDYALDEIPGALDWWYGDKLARVAA